MKHFLTKSLLVQIPGKLRWWSLFGEPENVTTLTPGGMASQAQAYYFRPGAIWGVSRQSYNAWGLTSWEILLLRAVSPGESFSPVPGIEPGAEVLVHIRRKEQCEKFLRLLESMPDHGLRPAECEHLFRKLEPYFRIGVFSLRLLENPDAIVSGGQ